MVRLYGGQVLDWGFYGFAGYVAFDPREFTDAQQIVIAAAGTAVNLLLAGIAVALVFLKRPPFRAAINELLITFTWISLLNALVVYPLLDFVSGLEGDWTQMYRRPCAGAQPGDSHHPHHRAGYSLLGMEEPGDECACGAAHRRVAPIRSHFGDVTAAGNL